MVVLAFGRRCVARAVAVYATSHRDAAIRSAEEADVLYRKTLKTRANATKEFWESDDGMRYVWDVSEPRKTSKDSQGALKYVTAYKVMIAVQDLVPLCPVGTRRAVLRAPTTRSRR